MRKSHLLVYLGLFGSTLAVPVTARADEAIAVSAEEPAEARPISPPVEVPNRHWASHWERFDVAGGVIIAVAEGAAWAVYLAEPVREAHWTARLPFDDELRASLRFGGAPDREVLTVASDVILGVMLAWPVLVDAILLAGVVHGDDDAALQMALIDMEALAIAHMVAWLTSRLAGRVRPEAMECTLAGTCDASGSGPVASFVGGHTIMAFTSAGLVCAHHIENPWLTGSRDGAAIACGTGIGLATAMSFMRIGNDRHWSSDIGFGALIGAAIGFGVPYLLHYGRSRPTGSARTSASPISRLAVGPGTDGGPLGLTVSGAF